ncbi:hypothetical protein F8388_012640 [Cannabis sativa]|uniref:Uncharacterized protein n=1 Tax=Cannabis sativa TaxID=3483 RepID=A0A7J6HU20_CANSA|nr:hypothetical protein F8388_012640 [Cannabis sativa]KAF4398726.1 hypothetical protein G4B88_017152 [Cannabis sativa]
MATLQLLFFFLFPAFPSSLFALSETTTISENDSFRDLQQIKLNMAHLESRHEEIIRILNERGFHIEEQEKLVEQLSHKIQLLQSTVSNFKSNERINALEERIKALEEEVSQLWASSRNNNFDIHVLKSKAYEAEEKLKKVASKAEKMADIVTEQWIQIQQLEQALHIAERRTLKARRSLIYSRCSFLKFINKVLGGHLENGFEILDPYILQSKRVFAVAKEYHHELQRFIKREMEKNKFTAALANWELVFFMASALITFPIFSAWVLLSSQLR